MGLGAKPAQRRRPPSVAVLLPCHNEEAAIAGVVEEFREALPSASIYVYDNASTDRTREVAAAAGAELRTEPALGKGNVLRRMFADIEADVYVLADGDGTYEAAAAPELVAKLVAENLDHVVGVRSADGEAAAYRKGHRAGNRFVNFLVSIVFGGVLTDILSGYRVMSRRFVKTIPLTSCGFEVETEMAIHCVQMRIPCAEVATQYRSRKDGSSSKLNTWRDGWRILRSLAALTKEVHPFRYFFFAAGFLVAVLAGVLAVPVFSFYLETGLVPRLPTAILCMGLGLVAFGCLLAGTVLDSLRQSRYEARRLAYLRYPAILEVAGQSAARSGGTEEAGSSMHPGAPDSATRSA